MRPSILLLLLLFLAASPDSRSQDKKDAFGDPLPAGTIARIGTARYRLPPSSQPGTALMSPDGKLLAVRTEEVIDLWELPAWKRRRLTTGGALDDGDPPKFHVLKFSGDSKKLVVLGGQHIYLLDVANGKPLKKLAIPKRDHPSSYIFVSLSQDERRLVVANDNFGAGGEEVFVWDLTKDKLVRSFMSSNQSSTPYEVVSADGRWLVKCDVENDGGGPGENSFIEFWDLSTGKSARKCATESLMRIIAFSPDGKWLAASSGRSILRIYEAATGQEKHNIRLRQETINRLEFSPDSRSFYAMSHRGQITRWDPVNGERTATYQAPNGGVARQLSFQPDGKLLAMNVSAQRVHLWEVTTGKLILPTGLPGDVFSEVAFSAQGELFTASDDGMTAWWNARTGAKLRDLKLEFVSAELQERPSQVIGPGGKFVTMSFSGEFLILGNGDQLGLFEVKTGKFLYGEPFNAGDGGVGFLDGGAKAVSIQNKKVRIWNTRTGRDLLTFTLPLRKGERPYRLNISPNGKHFAFAASAGQPHVLVWDLDKQKITRQWPMPNNVECMVFSADSRWLVSLGAQGQVIVHRVDSAKGDYDLIPPGETTQVAFSPDGRQLACATYTPRVSLHSSRLFIYELASKKIRLDLVGHSDGAIDRLAFSRDGGLLASGATDTTVLVWNAGLRAFASRPSDKDAELADGFQQMAGADAKAAYQHMIKLAQKPTQAVTLLDSKIAPAKLDSGEKTVAQWIQGLGSGNFGVRGKANAMLQKFGRSIEPDLRAALPMAKDVETKRRIEELLDGILAHENTPAEILHIRAVEVLEAIATPEARALLTRWSAGDPGTVLTVESRQALARLAPATKAEK